MKNVSEQVKKSVMLLSLDEIMTINHTQYREKLTEYFNRVNVTDFNSDVLHDINGLKYNDEHFITRL
jgi:hypothetical protein